MAHIRKQQICFFLTSKCNLKCKYCCTLKTDVVKKEHQALSFSFAKRAIDDFFRDFPSKEIRFYGAGEPTLKFDLLREITKYARLRAGDKLKVELQTNGFFSESIAQWIAQNVNILWVSCDGPPEIQDFQRPTKKGKPSSILVEKNIRFFAKQKHMQVGIRTTATSLTIHRQMEVIKYFHNLGIKYVNVHPACAPVGGNSDPIFHWDPVDFAKNFLEAHTEAKKLGVFYNSLYIANFDEKTRYACRACIPCPHITTDGYVSCCDFAQFGPEYAPGPLQQLIYGQYIAEEDRIVYDEEKIHNIRLRCVENLEKGLCKNCQFIYHCAGGCLGQVVNETGNLFGIHERNCRVTKYLAERMPLEKELYPVLHS